MVRREGLGKRHFLICHDSHYHTSPKCGRAWLLGPELTRASWPCCVPGLRQECREGRKRGCPWSLLPAFLTLFNPDTGCSISLLSQLHFCLPFPLPHTRTEFTSLSSSSTGSILIHISVPILSCLSPFPPHHHCQYFCHSHVAKQGSKDCTHETAFPT